jgi:DNA-directed RNA polymerase III subunit RPC4
MSGNRLPSFRGPRDLSLGGGTSKPGVRGTGRLGAGAKPPIDADKKKKFVPNLSVQRRDVKLEPEASAAEKKVSSGWKQRSNKTGDNARNGKGGSRPELIQTMGTVFSEGVGDDVGIRRKAAGSRCGGGTDRESSANMERPKIDLNAKYDKAAEEQKLKDLLRDDFIDDLKTGHLVPVQLPMVDTGKVFKDEAKIEKPKVLPTKDSDDDDESVVRTSKMKKNVIVDSDDDEEEVKGTDENTSETPTLIDLVKSQKGDLLFVQLPDHLPGRAKIKVEEAPEKTVLRNLTEGYLGKLQIRKSGKTQLLLNDTLLDVDVGTQVGFLQELFSIGLMPTADSREPKGHMINLGRVRHRVVATPAWNELFVSAGSMNNDNGGSSTSDSDDENA